jgi:GTP cyclohydrolase I
MTMLDGEDQLFDDKHKMLITQIAEHYKAILALIGENPSREGLLKTPYRAAKALVEVTAGYEQNPAEILKSAIFQYAGSNMVIVKDIEFYSLCEHHILPFFGKVSIGYIPDGEMVGLSKLARVVNSFAKRLQVQERLTSEICDLIYNTLATKGVIVVCEAGHLCMKMRGVEKQDAVTVTTDFRGEFCDAPRREEFLRLIKSH